MTIRSNVTFKHYSKSKNIVSLTTIHAWRPITKEKKNHQQSIVVCNSFATRKIRFTLNCTRHNSNAQCVLPLERQDFVRFLRIFNILLSIYYYHRFVSRRLLAVSNDQTSYTGVFQNSLQFSYFKMSILTTAVATRIDDKACLKK